jgi:putative transposase
MPAGMPNYPKHIVAFPYQGENRYSVTICTHQRYKAFTSAGTVALVREQLLRAGGEMDIAILAYCFMPDHLHLVLEGRSEQADLKQFINRAKQYSGYRFARAHDGRKLWQRYCFEHVLHDNESTQRTIRYVLENPVRKGMVNHPREYPFLGSGEYTLEELLEFAYSVSSSDHRAG